MRHYVLGNWSAVGKLAIYAPRLVIEHNTWQDKLYLFLRSLARSYFLFLEMFNLSETVLIIDHHLTRSFTVSFQLCRIFPVFKMLLQLSLKRSLGRPIGREPSASSPYNNRSQVLLSSIRETCPSHRKRLCASRTSMSTTSDFASTSSLDTRSNQRIFKIDRRCLCWMVRSCLTSCE